MARWIRYGVSGTDICFSRRHPGTNDMPGRLIFSTTADGASSPTERMRIDSAGKLVVGATSFNSAANAYTQVMTSGSQGGIIINSTDTSSLWMDVYCLHLMDYFQANEGLIRYNNNDYHMAFYTQGAERLRIDSDYLVLSRNHTDTQSPTPILTWLAQMQQLGVSNRYKH